MYVLFSTLPKVNIRSKSAGKMHWKSVPSRAASLCWGYRTPWIMHIRAPLGVQLGLGALPAARKQALPRQLCVQVGLSSPVCSERFCLQGEACPACS